MTVHRSADLARCLAIGLVTSAWACDSSGGDTMPETASAIASMRGNRSWATADDEEARNVPLLATRRSLNCVYKQPSDSCSLVPRFVPMHVMDSATLHSQADSIECWLDPTPFERYFDETLKTSLRSFFANPATTLCDGEKYPEIFLDSHVVSDGQGSSFLVDAAQLQEQLGADVQLPDAPAMAFASGHQFSRRPRGAWDPSFAALACQDTALIFDFLHSSPRRADFPERVVVDPRNVFFCKDVLVGRYDDDSDYAVFSLDGSPEGRKGFAISTNLFDDQPLCSRSHPYEQPTMAYDGGRVKRQHQKRFGPDTIGTTNFSVNGVSGAPEYDCDSKAALGIHVVAPQGLYPGVEPFCFQTERDGCRVPPALVLDSLSRSVHDCSVVSANDPNEFCIGGAVARNDGCWRFVHLREETGFMHDLVSTTGPVSVPMYPGATRMQDVLDGLRAAFKKLP